MTAEEQLLSAMRDGWRLYNDMSPMSDERVWHFEMDGKRTEVDTEVARGLALAGVVATDDLCPCGRVEYVLRNG